MNNWIQTIQNMADVVFFFFFTLKTKKEKTKLIFILLTSQAGAPACRACTWGASTYSLSKLQLNHSLRFNAIRRLMSSISANIYPLGQMLEASLACIGQLSLSVNGSVRSPSHALIQSAPLFRLIKAEGCRDSRSYSVSPCAHFKTAGSLRTVIVWLTLHSVLISSLR